MLKQVLCCSLEDRAGDDKKKTCDLASVGRKFTRGLRQKNTGLKICKAFMIETNKKKVKCEADKEN